MYCTNCGNHNDSIRSYCVACGMPVAGGAATVAPGRAYDSYRYETTRVSALGAAWRDITDTPGWWKKVLFLCLISCIPIVNLAVDGFALRWSRGLSFDRNEPLPKAVFKKKEILTGFRALLLNIIFGIVFMLASFVVTTLISGLFASINSGLGAAMSVILTVFSIVFYFLVYWPMVNASIMRMTVVDYLESGLNFQKVWGVFRRSPGGAIGATIVPSLVSALIQFVLWVLFFAIIGAVLQSAANDYMSMMSNNYGYLNYMANPYGIIDDTLSYVYGLGNLAVMLMIITLIATEMVAMFSKILTWRAMGHWAAEAATEWPFESDEEDAAQRVYSQAMTQDVAPHRADDVNRPQYDLFAENDNWNLGNTPNTPYDGMRNSTHNSARSNTHNSARMHEANYVENLDDSTIVSPKQLVKGISLVRISTKATYEVSSLPAVIGKGSAADVVIDGAKSISRTHARVAFDGNSVTIEDLKSTNGTTINGEPIPAHVPTAIQEGDIVSLSDEDFRVVLN